ncbi:hypothetical protein ABB37_06190 [Leptomonas pyrrhocoris]|uniref:Transmembrane protein n=1 Tax=Leptomonas pyrrhocoris TaxID=157538 RepID=A0A0M9FY94_LEPPY|nr:hypothetical protein ABB37_06190 [Leptomonas pyrrhocoris]KPA78590.1 hypothetical protein ABB37_06190 [Leptomonas pyrrhocoris]|eukprot:XP_015657029.1 hypothetical protein ABB37_06190 [Leptomonas pyrrhocoris]
MPSINTLIAAFLVAAVSFVNVVEAQAPGTFTDENVRHQKCSKGCVAGLLVMAGVAAVFFSGVMCFAIWPAAELTSRQEKRAAARKRIQERKEAEEEARAKNEALKDDE